MTVLKLKNSTSTTPPSSLEAGELALCTLAGSEKLYTKNSNNAIVDLLNKSGLATYTYVDGTFLKLAGGTMTGNLTVPSITNTGLYKGGVLDTQAASNTVMIPFVFNDIAHLDKRGGSIETNYGSIPTTLVDGSANYITYTPSALTENVPSGLTITFNLHKSFTYISKIGVSFMTSYNACKYIKIEVYDDLLSDWVIIGETNDNANNVYQVSTSMSSRSKLRFTFNDYNSLTTNGFRIAGIWLYNYQSKGAKEICVGRDGGEMYGSLYPYATESYLNLGTSTKKWNNVYANNFNGALVGNASTATKLATARTIWGKNFDGSGNVSGALTGVSTISASGSVTVSSIQTLNDTNYSLILRNSTAPALYVQSSSTGTTQIASFRYGSATAGAGTEVLAINSTGISVTGTATISSTVTAPTFSGALSGNASSATKLATARTIWGQSFDGTGNVSGAMTGVSTITASGTITAPTFSGALSGNASTATKLQTTRTIWGQSFDGTANVSGALTGVSTITASGNITAGGELTAYVASDKRLKKNIKQINNALDVINKLEAVSYNWNSNAKKLNENKTDQKDFGLIAQDVEAIVPEIVHNIHNEEYKAIDYIKLIPFLIKSVQELNNKVEKQQEIIKQLQNN